MKKICIVLLTALLLVLVTGCGKDESRLLDVDTTVDNDKSDATSEDKMQVSGNEQETETDTKEDSNEVKVLVVYFSATGNTKVIAEDIARELESDIYEIVPVEPYTSEDIAYNNDNCRANKEHSDSSIRPEIAGIIDNMDDYDVVLIGYPIWWGEEPRIIDTFVESYDLSDKGVATFCTSGGSGIATSESNLKGLCPDSVTWLGSKRFENNASVEDINAWITEINLEDN